MLVGVVGAAVGTGNSLLYLVLGSLCATLVLSSILLSGTARGRVRRGSRRRPRGRGATGPSSWRTAVAWAARGRCGSRARRRPPRKRGWPRPGGAGRAGGPLGPGALVFTERGAVSSVGWCWRAASLRPRSPLAPPAPRRRAGGLARRRGGRGRAARQGRCHPAGPAPTGPSGLRGLRPYVPGTPCAICWPTTARLGAPWWSSGTASRRAGPGRARGRPGRALGDGLSRATGQVQLHFHAGRAVGLGLKATTPADVGRLASGRRTALAPRRGGFAR